MKRSTRFAGAVIAFPIIVALTVVEIAKLVFEATAYVTEVLYTGIRHNDWYL